MKKRIVLILLSLLITLVTLACTPKMESTSDQVKESKPIEKPIESEKSVETGSVPTPEKPVMLSIGSATSGGTFYIFSSGVSSVVSSEVKNVDLTVEATQGAGANIELLRNESIDIGIAEASMGYDAMEGIGDFKDSGKFEDLRAIIACYPNKWTALTLDKKINDTTQLDGKKIGVSTFLSGAHLGSMKIYGDALGMNNVEYVNTAYADGFIEMHEGRLDALSMLTGHPSSPILELETKADINFVKLTPDQIDKVLEEVPSYSRDTIPAGTYKALTEDYETVSNWVVLFVRKDMDENLVYHITKAIMENNGSMVATHSVATNTIPENAIRQPMPLHKGAIKYFEEIGIELPEKLIRD